jgi:CHAD domain-containing protein
MPSLEFTLDPADLLRLAKWGSMRAGRSFPTTIDWHDTEDGALAKTGRCLANAGTLWRLAPLHPETAITVPPPQAEARSLALLPGGMPPGIAPSARFTGYRRALRWTEGQDDVALHVLDGRFDAPAQRRKPPEHCRITLNGPRAALPSLAIAIAHDMRLGVPRWGLAEQALAAARGETPPPRALGAPQVAEGQPVTDSLATIAGHLLDTMLHWAHQVPAARTPEPVHQMRVATRRLRSALSIYKPVAACPDLAALAVTLKFCAARLGTARDWDVFIDGLGAQLAAAFPGDPRCTAMLRAAARRRRNAYTELRSFLAGPDFRTLTVALACAATLRPWEDAVPGGESPPALQQDTAHFAATVLAKRMKRVRQAGRGIETLPIPALHELRKDCKRLRYAAEFFSSLFPTKKTKRFLQRLADLQEELGLLNDSAAVSGLMAQLGRLERSYAAGLVEGFSAAHAGTARERIEQAWKRFKATAPFW